MIKDEILQGVQKAYQCVTVPRGQEEEPQFSVDYVGGLYGYAVRELGRYSDALWDIGRAWRRFKEYASTIPLRIGHEYRVGASTFVVREVKTVRGVNGLPTIGADEDIEIVYLVEGV
jgi:hypothetical protein